MATIIHYQSPLSIFYDNYEIKEKLIKEARLKIKWYRDSYPSDIDAERKELEEEWENYINTLETLEPYVSEKEW
jgi:hypothetical protein